jgi:molybdate transport repressor ModE-like protein
MAIWAFINLTSANGANIGNSRAAFLEGIARYGSIGTTAKAMGLSFQQVWSAAQTLNAQFGQLYTTKRGRNSGGSQLTTRGEEVLRLFRKIESELYRVCAPELKRLEELVGEDPAAPRPIDHWARLEDPESWKQQQKLTNQTKKKPAKKEQTKKRTSRYGVLSTARRANSPQKKPGPANTKTKR